MRVLHSIPTNWSEGIPLPVTVKGLGFRATSILSKSARSTVVRVVDAEGRAAALKICNPQTYSIERSYHNHGQILTRISELRGTPGVVQLLHSGSYSPHGSDVWWELMELADCTLEDLLTRRPSESQRYVLAGQVLSYIGSALNEMGTNHQMRWNDCKPANIFVFEHDDGTRSLKAGDWETADFVNDPYLPPNKVVGTRRYMAPEALAGSGDRRSDWFSLGVVLVEVITGQGPRKHEGAAKHKRPFASETYDLITDTAWRSLLLRMTEIDPARRDASLHRAMKTLGGGLPLPPARSDSAAGLRGVAAEASEAVVTAATSIIKGAGSITGSATIARWKPVARWTLLLALAVTLLNLTVSSNLDGSLPLFHTTRYFLISLLAPLLWMVIGIASALIIALGADRARGTSVPLSSPPRWRPKFQAAIVTCSLLAVGSALYIGEPRIPPQSWPAFGLSLAFFACVLEVAAVLDQKQLGWGCSGSATKRALWRAASYGIGASLVAFTMLGALFIDNLQYRQASTELVSQSKDVISEKCHSPESLIEPRRLRSGITGEAYCSLSESSLSNHVRFIQFGSVDVAAEYDAVFRSRVSFDRRETSKAKCTSNGATGYWREDDSHGTYFCKRSGSKYRLIWTNLASGMAVQVRTRGPKPGSANPLAWWRFARTWDPR